MDKEPSRPASPEPEPAQTAADPEEEAPGIFLSQVQAQPVDWLWDKRLSQAFAHYHEHPSAIMRGDPRLLEWDDPLSTTTALPDTAIPLRQGLQPSLLEQAQSRLGLTADAPPWFPTVPGMHQTPRALTGTMLGNYMRHQQCDRLLSFDLLPFAQQPPKRALVDSPTGALRAEQGQVYEEHVLTWLQQQDVELYHIPEQDSGGDDRFRLLLTPLPAAPPPLSQRPVPSLTWCSQCSSRPAAWVLTRLWSARWMALAFLI